MRAYWKFFPPHSPHLLLYNQLLINAQAIPRGNERFAHKHCIVSPGLFKHYFDAVGEADGACVRFHLSSHRQGRKSKRKENVEPDSFHKVKTLKFGNNG